MNGAGNLDRGQAQAVEASMMDYLRLLREQKKIVMRRQEFYATHYDEAESDSPEGRSERLRKMMDETPELQLPSINEEPLTEGVRGEGTRDQ